MSRGWYRLLYLAPFVAFLGLALFILYHRIGARSDPSLVPSQLADKQAPSFTLPSLRSGETDLASADLKGRPVVINFFASWCIPCRAEHPMLEALHRDGVEIVGIAYKDKPDATRKFLDQLGDPYAHIGTDQDGRVGIDWGVTGVPETYVLDKSGTVRFWQRAPLSEADVDTRLKPLLQALAK
jgi:cytochrome c biogenesis protein CcmG/thiol:disulfide interchange protein DsbE